MTGCNRTTRYRQHIVNYLYKSHFDVSLPEVAFVANENNGDVVAIFDATNLLATVGHFSKGLGVVDGEDEQKTFSGPHVLVSHGAVLFLSRCVQNV